MPHVKIKAAEEANYDSRSSDNWREVTKTAIPGTSGKKHGIDATLHPALGLQDSFGRLRVSSVTTIFDSKQLYDNQPFFWDDQETAGSGTSSSHSTALAATTISVGNTTTGTRVRQTFQRFNYEPGKSQLVFMTGVLGAGAAGITRRIGYFHANNGLFFELSETTLNVVRRTATSGSPVDNQVAQSAWNLDKLDGTGPSGITLDTSKAQIFFIDFEWLGVGSVRFGVVIDGVLHYCHQMNHANSLTSVYMSSPNLPLRYEISNDGTGAAASLIHICTSVITEGGTAENGILRHIDGGAVGPIGTSNKYALIGIRLKSTHLDASIILESLSLLATTVNDQADWELILNPTVAGTFTYADQTNSAVQIAQGAATNTVSGGTLIDGGFYTTNQSVVASVRNALRLGAAIDGTPDEIVLVTRPISGNISVESSLTWKELS